MKGNDVTDGAIYGATECAGANGLGYGAVFEVTLTGTEEVAHSFNNEGDGANPIAGLTNVGGTLYGATGRGPSGAAGTVFSLTAAGVLKVLQPFTFGGDGGNPAATLTNVGGVLYGTTSFATIFRITTTGAETDLYTIEGKTFGGSAPSNFFGDLTDVAGTLYATTQYGGAYGDGAVLKATP